MTYLYHWIKLGREHLKEHRPKLYAQLVKAGKLESHLKQAANQTYREVNDLEEQGMTPHEAWEATREKYLLVPPEKPE